LFSKEKCSPTESCRTPPDPGPLNTTLDNSSAAFLGTLSRGVALEDKERQDPDEGGRPIWVTPDALWFRWTRIWEDIQRAQKVEVREKADLKRRICKAVGAPDFVHDRFVFRGRRLSYVVFTREWLDALQGLADGTDGVTET
jgi:hypothetical protein